VSAALLTSTLVSIGGVAFAAYLGLAGGGEATLSRHVTIGIFSAMMTLLSHSMMMFYFIGKGRAVRDAAREGGLSGEFEARIALLRKPVFSIGTLAMVLTMATAILGASVDTGVLPAAAHGVLAYSCLIVNLGALRVEVIALMESGRIVSEVNRLLSV
jgi:hypothetical protein